MTKKVLAITLAILVICASAFAQSIIEVNQPSQSSLPVQGSTVNGFVVDEISDFDMIGATVYEFQHIKTGATVLYVANEDTNRTFDIIFRTPTETDAGIPHVFEHSTLDGSAKFPSKALWFNVSYQTYNTYMNASTFPFMTQYPVASLSEEQLYTLADFYTDSVFNPMVMEDKSIFDEEAWRYELKSADDELTLNGTVYSEMLGATTRERKAGKNFEREIFPNSYAANDSGGNPDVIPSMTWEEIKAYHDKYYHPSNSLTILYGKFDDWAKFLDLLDSYFSAYEKKDFDLTDYGYTPITGPVVAEYDFPVEASSDTEHAATVYYGFVCKDVDQETMNQIDLMTTLAGDTSSVLMENLRNALPYGDFNCYIDFGGPEVIVEFIANTVNPEDAETFKAIVDQSMAQIAEEGFNPVAVDSIVAAFRLDIMLSGESSSVGIDMMPNIAYYWAGTGYLYGYQDFIDSIDNFQKWNDDGTFKDIISKYIVNNDINAIVTTKAVAGLKEEKDAQLAAHLAEVKAGMSEEEIAAIVKATTEPEEEDVDTAAMVRQIKVVDVESLPEEARIYDIEDEVSEDGIRRIWAQADVSGVGYGGFLLDASGLTQDQIHFFKLYTSLLGNLDTKEHTRVELSSLMTRYLYDGTIKMSLIEDDNTKEMTPRLRAGFIAMDEDMDEAYDLLSELIYDTVFEPAKVKDQVASFKTSLKSTITNSSYNISLYRALAADSEIDAYYNYANFLDYYYFLDAVEAQLEADPQPIIDNLNAIVEYFDNSTNGIILFAGSEESYKNYLEVANAFMAGLGKSPIEVQSYEFETPADSEALIVDSSVNYNIIYTNSDVLGYGDEPSGDFDAVSSLVADMYLLPELRDKGGAYGAYMYMTADGFYTLSYRDPSILSTFEVYDGLADFIANLDIDQETLDGYILSSYSGYALSTGELTGASSAVLSQIGYEDQNDIFKYMKELKGLKAETFNETYAPLFQTFVDNYKYYTSGGAAAVGEVAQYFESVINPFGVQDKSQMTLADLVEGTPFYEVTNAVFINGLMSPISDSEFGVNAPATLGELAQIFVMLLGGAYTQEDSIAFLAQYGIVPAAPADTELTVAEMDSICCSFLAVAAGVSMDTLSIADFEALGIDAGAPATREMMAYEIYVIALEE